MQLVTTTKHEQAIRRSMAEADGNALPPYLLRTLTPCPTPRSSKSYCDSQQPSEAAWALPIRSNLQVDFHIPMPPSRSEGQRSPHNALIIVLTSGFLHAWQWTAGMGTVYRCISLVVLVVFSLLWLAWPQEACTHH
jgi:hypothetical protein